MRAARFHEPRKAIRVEEVPVPEPGEHGAVVRILGAGVCHSDLHIVAGEVPLPRRPLVLGHENAGVVERVGPSVDAVRPGDRVAVSGAWGCGACRACARGEENLCRRPSWPGISVDGGWAELLKVPDVRQRVPLGELDAVEAAPLTDAGLTPYRAICKALPRLSPGDAVAVIGVGGLGYLALQILRAVSPAVRTIAVDQSDEKLELARELGADLCVDARGDAAAAIKKWTDGEGAAAVIDFVGSETTLRTAAAASARQGMIVLVGIAGGSLPFSFSGVPTECVLTASAWGTRAELAAVLELARLGRVHAHVERQPLEAINEVLARLETGQVRGRVVLTP